MFRITISGSADIGTERRFLEAAVALVEQYGQHIDSATATTEFHANVDLTEGLNIVLGEPTPTPTFVTKIAGETFEQYRERLFTYNASVPPDQQFPSTLTDAEWTVLTPDPTPAA